MAKEFQEFIEPILEVFEQHKVVRVVTELEDGVCSPKFTTYMTKEQFEAMYNDFEVEIAFRPYMITKIKDYYEKCGNAYIKVEGVGI